MKAVIEVDIPDYQIGQEVNIYFKDTMMIKGVVQEPKWIPVSERLPEEKVEQRIRSFGNAESYCHRCGIKMPESYYNFCFNCGTNLRRGERRFM